MNSPRSPELGQGQLQGAQGRLPINGAIQPIIFEPRVGRGLASSHYGQKRTLNNRLKQGIAIVQDLTKNWLGLVQFMAHARVFKPLGREHENNAWSCPGCGYVLPETVEFFSFHKSAKPVMNFRQAVDYQAESVGLVGLPAIDAVTIIRDMGVRHDALGMTNGIFAFIIYICHILMMPTGQIPQVFR